jgi:type IV pilus assembly protein PilN
MIRINLLPHREQARKDRRRQFISLVVLTVIAGAVIWFIGYVFLQQRLESQQASNDYLKSQISQLNKEIEQIAGIKEQTQALLARKQVIESLQGTRMQTVTMFNELTRQMPEGVYLKSVKQTGGKVNVTGYAQSNARVSQLMRNLDASPIFENPTLIEIKATTLNRRVVSEYNLDLSIEKPPVDDGSKKAVPAAGASVPAASAPVGGK